MPGCDSAVRVSAAGAGRLRLFSRLSENERSVDFDSEVRLQLPLARVMPYVAGWMGQGSGSVSVSKLIERVSTA